MADLRPRSDDGSDDLDLTISGSELQITFSADDILICRDRPLLEWVPLNTSTAGMPDAMPHHTMHRVVLLCFTWLMVGMLRRW